MDPHTSTLADVTDDGSGRGALWGRRVFLALLLVFVLAGATGLLGVRSATVSASDQGYDLSVEYAASARAGLDVPLEIRVHHEGGFGNQVVISITGDYFDIFETQGFTPDPSAATRGADDLQLTFDAPPGDTFVVAYDAYIQPSSQQGRDAVVTVVDDGTPVVSTSLSTWLWP